MLKSDQNFGGSIPGQYDRYLRPLIFEAYAEDMAQRIASLSPHAILETAAGTGVVTTLLAKALKSGDTLMVTDLNPAMLALAQGSVSVPGVTFQHADATALPFADNSFDVVACQFGIMFFPDKLAGCKEALRVLRKGGTFIFNVWDKLAFNDLSSLVNDTTAKMFPGNAPDFMARVPFGYNDVDKIKAMLSEAGFINVSADVLPKRSKAPSARDPAIGFCQGTPLRGEIEARDVARLEEATEKSAEAIAQKFGMGPIDAPMQAIVFTAVRD
jgi:ubiquinone/menaquinone biosynthesis C-methylase UbiE